MIELMHDYNLFMQVISDHFLFIFSYSINYFTRLNNYLKRKS